jgi:hypothetical protein
MRSSRRSSYEFGAIKPLEISALYGDVKVLLDEAEA